MRTKRNVPHVPRGIGKPSQNLPGLKRIRFWMTFGEEYLTHLRVLSNVGMTSIEPITTKAKILCPCNF